MVHLECRSLLSGAAADVLSAVAVPIDSGTPVDGSLDSGGVAFFEVDSPTDALLTVQVQMAQGVPQLSLLDAGGQVLLQSDGPSPEDRDASIVVHVSAGSQYLELENFGDGGAYSFTTTLIASSAPFQPIPAGTGAAAIVAGDWSGDGFTGLAVANELDNTVSVFLGNGDGTFQPPVAYPVGNGPDALVAADFDGRHRPDGSPILDLAVTNFDDNTVSVLLGNGDGTFQSPVTYAVGDGPDALLAGDFDGRTGPNGSSIVDLAVANRSGNTVSVLLGNGDGTFEPPLTYPVGNTPDALVAGDFNGAERPDGSSILDLAVANEGSLFPDGNPVPGTGSVSVLLGNGDGTFQNAVAYAAGNGPDAVVAGDWSGDGRTDLAVTDLGSFDSYTGTALPNTGTVSVLLGNGDGTFQNAVAYAVSAGPFGLVAGDFNGDGRIDLAVADKDDNAVSVLLGNGDGTFKNQVITTLGYGPLALLAGDFNRDGRIDLAVCDFGTLDASGSPLADSGTVSVLLGNGNGTFQNPVTDAVRYGASAVVAGDFTGDGRTDLAVANTADNTVSVLLGNGDGTFQNEVTYTVGSLPFAPLGG